MTAEIQGAETEGNEPLPKHLAKAKVFFMNKQDGHKEAEDSGSSVGGVTFRDEARTDASVGLLRAGTHRTI